MGDPVTLETLEEYERLMSRSLLIWDNVLYELSHELGIEEREHIARVRDEIQSLRQWFARQDEQPLDPDSLWRELDMEFNALHKMIHGLPNREPLHRKARVCEQLLRDLRLRRGDT